MKKTIIISLMIIISGCSEKQEYEQIVLEQMKIEKDINDYKIDPAVMTKCVVETTAEKMPGIMPLDPYRRDTYRKYSKMLLLSSSNDPKKTLEELRVEFGSAKKLADAHANYTESVVSCMSDLVSRTESSTIADEEKK